MSEVLPGAEVTSQAPAKETPAPPAVEQAKEPVVTPDPKQGDVTVKAEPDPKVVVETPVVEPPKPPEKYELKPKKDSPLLKADLEEIESAAKAKGLSQEDAQKMVESKEADHEKFFSRQREMAIQEQSQWRKIAETDKEISGSDGKAFKENVELAHRALNRFADDSFKRVLSETGLGNNPHLIRTFLRIGKGMADDKAILDGKTVLPKKQSTAEKLYPTHSREKKE